MTGTELRSGSREGHQAGGTAWARPGGTRELWVGTVESVSCVGSGLWPQALFRGTRCSQAAVRDGAAQGRGLPRVRPVPSCPGLHSWSSRPYLPTICMLIRLFTPRGCSQDWPPPAPEADVPLQSLSRDRGQACRQGPAGISVPAAALCGRGRGRNWQPMPDVIIIMVTCAQVLVSKYHCPIKGTGAPWRNG